jgi:hypothetical protein
MNDASEFDFAMDVAKLCVKGLKIDRWRKASLTAEVKQARLAAKKSFAISLSAVGDQLSQWRGYTAPGAGYSIGFLPNAFEEIAGEFAGFILAPCVYDPTKQEELVGEVLRGALNGFNPFESPKPASVDWEGKAPVEVGVFLPETLAFLAPFIKHPSFAEEREWRLVSWPVDSNDLEVRHRPGSSSLVPFIDVPLRSAEGMLPISSITIGPTPNPNLSHAAVKSLLSAAGAAALRVEHSQCPFRSW